MDQKNCVNFFENFIFKCTLLRVKCVTWAHHIFLCDATCTKLINLFIPFHLGCSSANFSFQYRSGPDCLYNFSLFRNISSHNYLFFVPNTMSSSICNFRVKQQQKTLQSNSSTSRDYLDCMQPFDACVTEISI